NSGSAALSFRTAVYLATTADARASSAAFVLGRFNTTVQAATARNFNTSAFGPFTSTPITGSGNPIAVFFMLHEADDNHHISEDDESDDVTTDGQVVIFDC